jgi:hypothetical protein
MTQLTFENFLDPAYFDMWCLRVAGSKDLNKTLHFATTDEAHHAQALIKEWIADSISAAKEQGK